MVSLRRRIAVTAAVALIAAAYVAWFGYSTGQLGRGGSDFDQLWFAARALWNGDNPYELIGPGRAFDWQWPLLYPLPTIIAVLPLASLPLLVARVTFAGLSAGALAFALSGRRMGLLAVLGSAAVLDALRAGQLSVLLTAALFLNALAFVFILKPPIGITLLAASPRRRAIIVAVSTGALLTCAAFVARPHWVSSWWAAVRSTSHMRVPLLELGGPLLVLALLRWRRTDARVLLACACIPHTPALYDLVPLGFVARDFREALSFALLTDIALVAQVTLVQGLAPAMAATVAARILNLSVYLPALLAVLARPNAEDVGSPRHEVG